jgi:hypothetical protein
VSARIDAARALRKCAITTSHKADHFKRLLINVRTVAETNLGSRHALQRNKNARRLYCRECHALRGISPAGFHPSTTPKGVNGTRAQRIGVWSYRWRTINP